jgi:hypothetical protein
MAIDSKLPRELEGRTSVGVAFALVGALDPEAATRALGGTAPTQSWLAGEIVSPRRVPQKENGWSLRLPFIDPFTPFQTTEAIMMPILEILEAHADAWRELRASAAFEVWLTAIVWVHEGNYPAIEFGPAFMKRVANLDVTVDVDMYTL